MLNGFKHIRRLNSSIWSIDGVLISIFTLGWSGPGSNCNEEELHIPKSFMTGASPTDAVECYIDDTQLGSRTPMQS